MTKLSPAAQAVLDAVVDGALPPFHVIARPMAAAALRAAADQVVPENYLSYTGHSEHDFALEEKNDSVRKAILAIASELEDQ